MADLNPVTQCRTGTTIALTTKMTAGVDVTGRSSIAVDCQQGRLELSLLFKKTYFRPSPKFTRRWRSSNVAELYNSCVLCPKAGSVDDGATGSGLPLFSSTPGN